MLTPLKYYWETQSLGTYLRFYVLFRPFNKEPPEQRTAKLQLYALYLDSFDTYKKSLDLTD